MVLSTHTSDPPPVPALDAAIAGVERESQLEYLCAECKDWGTILLKIRGKDRMELCPTGCAAAQKFRQLRAEALGADGPGTG